MDLKQLRHQELQKQKDDRREHIISCAIDVFLSKGIAETTIADVAIASQVGVATVFRYFDTKRRLVIETAETLWTRQQEAFNQSLPIGSVEMNGLDKVMTLFGLFKKAYNKQPEIFRFLEQFDYFALQEVMDKNELTVYEQRILMLKEPFVQAVKQGISDGSIRSDVSIDEVYMTCTHMLMSLISKLVVRGSVLPSDLTVKAEVQIDLVLDMIRKYLGGK